MKRVEKAKIGLDEIRMLTLGVQVLVGFQLHAVFQPRFGQLPGSLRALQVAGLLVLLACLGALLVPATQHQLVERGEPTPRLERLITVSLNCACVGLALSLGADVLLAVYQAAGAPLAVAAGLLTGLMGAAFWFGWPCSLRGRQGRRERRMASQRVVQSTPLSEKIDQMLTEARTILPGAQALLGFQLMVVMTESFDRLSTVDKVAHVAALGFLALTVMLLMTPAALHRIVYSGEESLHLLALGSRLVMSATFPLSAAIALDTYVVSARALGSAGVARVLGVATFVALFSLWWIYPLAVRALRTAAVQER